MVYSGLEASGFIPVTLLLRGGTSNYDISVTVTPSDQSPVSAEGKWYVSYSYLLVSFDLLGNGVDYDSTAITTIFTAGSNSTIVTVPVIVDKIVEQSETFDLTITIPSSLQDHVIAGAITEAVANIIDDTSKKKSVRKRSYNMCF